MLDEDDDPTDLTQLAVPQVGSILDRGSLPALPSSRRGGAPIGCRAYFAELIACGRPATTQRSYGMDLLRWFRFLSSVGVAWEKATVLGAGLLPLAGDGPEPSRPHWRRPRTCRRGGQPSAPNALTGKRPPRAGLRPGDRRPRRSVLRAFYDFHLEVGTGPMVNPFPLVRGARRGRADAHHNPLEPFEEEGAAAATGRGPPCTPLG